MVIWKNVILESLDLECKLFEMSVFQEVDKKPAGTDLRATSLEEEPS